MQHGTITFNRTERIAIDHTIRTNSNSKKESSRFQRIARVSDVNKLFSVIITVMRRLKERTTFLLQALDGRTAIYNITRKRAIAKALHLEGHSDFAPDVLGFSGLFSLKILFSEVLRSAPGDRRVDSA